MRKIAISIPLALLAVPAAAQEKLIPGPYVSLGVGAQYLEGLSANGPRGQEATLNYNWGAMGIIAGGYAFGNGFRVEAEYGYRHSEAKNVTLPSGANTPTSQNLNTNAGASTYMVNALYDFYQLHWPVIPHLGAGVGVADIRVNSIGNDTPFAYQFIAGVDYPIPSQPKLKVGLDYRFLGTDSLSLTNSSLITSKPNYYDHAIVLHVSWSFGNPPPPPQPMGQSSFAPPAPPPPPPPAAQAAPPPPQPQTFTVFFALNSIALNAEARQTIAQAATAARSGQYTRLNVVGHTDTSGSAAHNQGLSERRAAVVRAELLRNGVPSNDIAASGVGESELAVPTGNHVKEPQNRRVIIEAQSPGA
jgi:outer membrane protein OmpA-like peptidoglycan-associated protein